jgi:hypothetical protein
MRPTSKLAALGAVVVTGIWLVLNIIYAVKYIWGIDPTGLAGMAPYISRVDISAANTIIFFFTAWFLYRGICLYDAVCKGKLPVAKVWNPSFPFPQGFKTLLIQLGLLGTIFAFIIAFNRLSVSSPQGQHVHDQAILIVPLGAALWSTFAGVGFAFVVVPGIQKIFISLMAVKPPREDSAHEIANLSNTLASFGTTTGATTHAMQQMLERASAINQILANIGASDFRQTANELASGVSALVNTMPQVADSQVQLSNTVAVLTRSVGELRAEFQGARAQLATLNKALGQSAAHAEESRRSLASLEERVAANSTACRDLSTHLAAGDHRLSDLSGSASKLEEEMTNLGSIMRQLKLTVAAVRPRQYRWWHGFGFWRKDQPEN